MPKVMAGLRQQTIPTRIVIVDNSPSAEFALPRAAAALADDVFRWNTNLGPLGRFIPALAFSDYDYAFFATDDFVVGPDCLGHLLRHAEPLGSNFATIGQEGRLYSRKTRRIVRRQIIASDELRKADLIVSAEIVPRRHIHHAIVFRDRLLSRFSQQVSIFEDDLLLSLGIQLATQLPTLVAPRPDTSESWRMTMLPSHHALCSRPDHNYRRNLFFRQAMKLGWRPIR